MFRLSFVYEKLENIEEQPFVFVLACVDLGLRVRTCSWIHSLASCIRRFVLACVYLFFSLCMVGSSQRMCAEFYVCKVSLAHAWH